MSYRLISDGTGSVTATTDRETWLIADGVSHTNSGDDAFSAGGFAGIALIVAGTLSATDDSDAVSQSPGAAGFKIHVETTGRIVGEGMFAYGIDVQGPAAEVVNEGHVLAKGTGYGVVFGVAAAGCTLVNSGVVRSLHGSAVAAFESVAVYNDGAILAPEREAFAFGGSGSLLVNTGTVSGKTGIVAATVLGQSNVVINDGLIRGTDRDAMLGLSGDEHVVNRGTLAGDVDLGGGDDTLDTRHGTITGAIHLGAGADRLIAGGGRQVADLGDGDDIATMGGGNDKVLGGTGNDELIGGGGADVLLGGDHNDQLRGGAGNDRLDGGTGNDVLIGGPGDDILTSGDGSDIFRFGRHAGNDRIDYDDSQDYVDLTAFHLAGFGRIAHALHLDHGNAVLDLDALGGHGSLTFVGTGVGDLDEGDFIL